MPREPLAAGPAAPRPPLGVLTKGAFCPVNETLVTAHAQMMRAALCAYCYAGRRFDAAAAVAAGVEGQLRELVAGIRFASAHAHVHAFAPTLRRRGHRCTCSSPLTNHIMACM